MWYNFAFLFLYFYLALFLVHTGYHHTNEVFNAFSHDYAYHAVSINLETQETYFDKQIIRDLVSDHFNVNLKRKTYNHLVTFYYDGRESSENEESAYFTIKLVASLGFGANFDKTFAYYLT